MSKEQRAKSQESIIKSASSAFSKPKSSSASDKEAQKKPEHNTRVFLRTNKLSL